MSVLQVLLAIVALGVLIIVHEGGHYWVARLFKMRVEKFSLGFGPAVLKWRSKDGETQFQVAPIPLGGFVQITGMNPHEEFEPNDPRVYPNRPTWQRFLTIFAGPFTNLLFSIVLIFVVYAGAGMPARFFMVEAVIPPTENAGKPSPSDGRLLPGDVIVEMDGRSMLATRGDIIPEKVQQSAGKPITVTVLRNGQLVAETITPQLHDDGKWYIGIKMDLLEKYESVSLGTATVEAAKYPWVKSAEMLGNIVGMIRGKVAADAAGPVGITNMIKRSINAGWMQAFEFLALLNVALGLFNLLPIPALDGGRLVFLGYELVTRRRPNPRVEAAVHMIGFVMLMLLFVVVTFKDIRGLFG